MQTEQIHIDNAVIENRTFTNIRLIIRADNVKVRNCTFERSSLLCLECSNPTVEQCTFRNSVRHAVQFDKVNGGGRVINNTFTEIVGGSNVSDIVNIYKSNGTRATPIRVSNNTISGGGPNSSGSGIMAGDNMGSWQIIDGNRLTDPGQVGIGVAGGSDITVSNNIINSAKHSYSNVACFVWGIPQRGSTVTRVTVTGNRARWISGKTGLPNGFWVGANVTGLVQRNNSWR
jgi:hypothetical protein